MDIKAKRENFMIQIRKAKRRDFFRQNRKKMFQSIELNHNPIEAQILTAISNF